MKSLLLAIISTFVIGIFTVQSAPGLNYKYYQGNWSLLPDFNALTPLKSGTVTSVNLDPRTREVQYAFLYQGYITIPTAGNYTFETLSDDGSKLYIGNYDFNTVPVVNNDGLHVSQIRTGTISLNAGVYPISLAYFQNDGNQIWQIYWSSNTGITRQLVPSTVLSTTNPSTSPATAGLNFSYYEGIWGLLPDFGALSPLKTGTLPNINLSPRNRESNYAFVYQGYISIPADGTYTFETFSDDGSKIYIGNYSFLTVPLVNNDGLHTSQLRGGSIALTAGVYPITMTFFQNIGNQVWEVYWSSNTGISRQKIPDNVLSTNGTSAPVPPSSSNGLSYNYYEGTWPALPDFSALTPVKTGTTTNIDLSPRNREVNYAFVWQGNINVPASGTYTFESVSDDGSKVYIGTTTTSLVNNDGPHPTQSKTGTVSLNAGLNPITITYFQQGGNQVIELYWSSTNGLSRQKVPDNAFTPTAITPPGIEVITTTPPPPVITPPPPPPTNSGSGGLTGKINYYFSSTYGDDSRTAAQATSSSTPWKTLSKLNSVMSVLKNGDAALFNRGDIFDGSINVSESGGTNTPIIFSSYGNGDKPVINGLYTLSGWVNIGNGVWQANCPSPDRVNMVTMNGVAQALGRYPNITEPNRGYLTLDAHAGAYLITDYQLSGSPNFTGAEVVIRKTNWVLDRCLITNHSGNNIFYNTPTAHEPTDGYGYFIQNSALTLDQLGEWYFDPNSRVLKMYFGSNNPGSYTIKASTVNTLITVSNKSNITIDNISFVGGDDYGVKVEYSQNVKLQNCSVDLSGTQAVSGQNLNGFTVEGNSITNTSNDAIDCNACSNTLVKSNSLKNTGLMIGMGLNGNQQYNGILVEGSGNTTELNTIENTGYSGITFAGENLTVKNNYVNNFCLTIEDGGGIYGWGDLTKYNRKIVGNIVLNGIGAFEGTSYAFSTGATGIFHDDESAHVDMSDNTVVNCSRSGILIHNSHDMTLRNNTVFNSRTQVSMVHDPISIYHPIRNITMDNNILFSRTASQFLIEMGTLSNDLGSFGSYNNNYYARPMDDNGVIYTYYRNNSGDNQFNYYDLPGWKTAYSGYDQQSKSSPLKVPAYKVTNFNGGNRYANTSFNSNASGIYCLSSPGRCAVSWNSGGRLDGGAVQVTFDGSNGAINNVGSYIEIGATTAGRNYQIKFSLLGYNAGKTIKAFLLDGSTYARLSETRFFSVTNTRTENDFIYTAPSTANTTLLALEISGPDCPFWLDNLQVYDVNTTITNPDDYIKFYYNATSSQKSVPLNGNFVDAKNNVYYGSINLDPFTSAVLINQAANQIADVTATERRTGVEALQSFTEDAVNSAILSANVSPNPASDNVRITLNAPQGTQKSTLSITSLTGAIVKTIPVTSSTQRLNLDVRTWSKGVYIINYNCDGRMVYKKFVKQ